MKAGAKNGELLITHLTCNRVQPKKGGPAALARSKGLKISHRKKKSTPSEMLHTISNLDIFGTPLALYNEREVWNKCTEKHRNNCRAVAINIGGSQNKGNFPEYLLKKGSVPCT